MKSDLYRNDRVLAGFLHRTFDFRMCVGPDESRRRIQWMERVDPGFGEWVLSQIEPLLDPNARPSLLITTGKLTGIQFNGDYEARSFWRYAWKLIRPDARYPLAIEHASNFDYQELRSRWAIANLNRLTRRQARGR